MAAPGDNYHHASDAVSDNIDNDYDRVTVASHPLVQQPPQSSAVAAVLREQPRTGPQSGFHEVLIGERIMRFDTAALRNEEGVIKVLEIGAIVFSLILAGNVFGVSGERGFALLVCVLAILFCVGIVLAKFLTLNQHFDAPQWALFESSIYIALGISFFIAALLMGVLCTLHWAENNPEWELVPAIATIALAVTGIIFLADACIVFYNRRYRSWTPQKQRPMAPA